MLCYIMPCELQKPQNEAEPPCVTTIRTPLSTHYSFHRRGTGQTDDEAMYVRPHRPIPFKTQKTSIHPPMDIDRPTSTSKIQPYKPTSPSDTMASSTCTTALLRQGHHEQLPRLSQARNRIISYASHPSSPSCFLASFLPSV